jgi:hypothetical protein
MTASLPEQRYLELRAARLHQPAPPAAQATGQTSHHTTGAGYANRSARGTESE